MPDPTALTAGPSRADRMRALGQTSLFSDLGRKELASVVGLMGERRFAAGSTVVTQGEVGIGFFVIASGLVDVIVDDEYVRSLGPGDHFGDIALIVESARTATVVAATDVACFTLTSWDFRRLVETDPGVSWRVMTAMARRLLGATDHPPTPAPTPSEPSPGEQHMIKRGPLMTLVAAASLALALLGLNTAGEPAQAPAPAAAVAPAAPAPDPPPGAPTGEAAGPTVIDLAGVAGAPTGQAGAPTVVDLADIASPQPAAGGFPAEAAYAGRTSGDEVTVAIAVKDGRAVAYLCDGERIEEWLEGTVDGSTLSLTGDNGIAVTGELADGALFGQVAVGGKRLPYAAVVATAPAGTYRGEVSVDGVQKEIGWIVLQDGSVTGLVNDGTAAPALDVTAVAATLDGVPVDVSPVTGADDVTG